VQTNQARVRDEVAPFHLTTHQNVYTEPPLSNRVEGGTLVAKRASADSRAGPAEARGKGQFAPSLYGRNVNALRWSEGVRAEATPSDGGQASRVTPQYDVPCVPPSQRRVHPVPVMAHCGHV
jgi:hypothetical protein